MREGAPAGGEPILLHVCCGPCAIHPHRVLMAEGFAPTGFFYNPNIQPSREYRRRLETLKDYGARAGLPLIVRNDYHPEDHIRSTADVFADRSRRCRVCYDLRLGEAAREAAAQGFGAFTSTLLVSPYQLHEQVREAGERSADTVGGKVRFVYRDFRPGWREGVAASREMGLYRQPYCGCLWSEVDRYERPRT